MILMCIAGIGIAYMSVDMLGALYFSIKKGS